MTAVAAFSLGFWAVTLAVAFARPGGVKGAFPLSALTFSIALAIWVLAGAVLA